MILYQLIEKYDNKHPMLKTIFTKPHKMIVKLLQKYGLVIDIEYPIEYDKYTLYSGDIHYNNIIIQKYMEIIGIVIHYFIKKMILLLNVETNFLQKMCGKKIIQE